MPATRLGSFVGAVLVLAVACGGSGSFDPATVDLADRPWQATLTYHPGDSLGNLHTCVAHWSMTVESHPAWAQDTATDWGMTIPPEATVSCDGAAPAYWITLAFYSFEIVQEGGRLLFISPGYGGWIEARLTSAERMAGDGPFTYNQQSMAWPPSTFQATR